MNDHPVGTSRSGWMLYGAYGYTGRLILEEALRRGHRPLLAGRDPERLRALAGSSGLDWAAVDLDDQAALERAVARVELVLHAAGPFSATHGPMVAACLRTGTHYLDITGELDVIEASFALDAEARRAGICIMSGVGFDVVPTDCAARYVADQVPGATELELALCGTGGMSVGTQRSALEGLAHGVRARRAGRIVELGPEVEARTVRFHDRERTVIPISWGDIASAFHTTGIPNITTYLAVSARSVPRFRVATRVLRPLLGLRMVRRPLSGLIRRFGRSPSRTELERSRSHVWARAANATGQSCEAWLELPGGYPLTAQASVRCVERTLSGKPSGALTPAMAFGADFILELEGCVRHLAPAVGK